ncbi:hypothetical protein BEP19_14040 [Ammoniphilus oxalaticus]|uniref:DUF2797 domain-containing protein n=1 Tax=Ammoniphilus oxalaticus TaxID=66863 RepID=A0A419SEJ4_9BACL|nr:DUF2797 domain-containing protein [Ammoniphilus oxalaticus]RKD21742.1 hypothetical protein BEP19_14040 [Ammoniphilus oxalaticus]
MFVRGFLQGLKHEYSSPITYYLPLGDEQVTLNDLLGREVRVSFLGEIECVKCGRKIKKTYQSGYCYPCVISLPETDLCIVRPHDCHYDEGTCRDAEFGEAYCMIPHYVYLAVSSGIKVGVTRKQNEMKRWVDQGAIQAIPIAETPNRKTAGELEVALSQHLPDKTNWRKMLRGEAELLDLLELREQAFSYFPEEYKRYAIEQEDWIEIVYPLLESLEKVRTYNLDKQPLLQDRLIGIKGQYLLFEGAVLNVRKYSGYKIEIGY